MCGGAIGETLVSTSTLFSTALGEGVARFVSASVVSIEADTAVRVAVDTLSVAEREVGVSCECEDENATLSSKVVGDTLRARNDGCGVWSTATSAGVCVSTSASAESLSVFVVVSVVAASDLVGVPTESGDCRECVSVDVVVGVGM